ncbi:hypothetical protein [Nostoc sp. ChiQUE01b]|uniref:hypothetical protein n=1 Tax=Nostoc sp. ChiQUE01b TaxID=3075376 RepID=UPI002AD40D9F|nr:hypothetical protein [Nostoc sp. ChiQUE01b]MDZ8260607.1 hypothetical protein [Nostoc sp. ChiQUE01b]
MNPLKVIAQVLTTLLTLLFLGWYGVFCFRLGWQARDNPILSSFATLVTGNNQKTEEKNCHDILGSRLGDCN